MDAAAWDAAYAATNDLEWGAAPNRWVAAQLSGATPGRALDLGAGEGRNSLWLAEQGWRVTAVDFSQAGLDKGRRREQPDQAVTWVCADVTTYEPDMASFDVVLLAYLHLVAPQRRAALRRAASGLRPGGVLLVIGHDTSNLVDGVGGPQDVSVLFTSEDVLADLSDLALRTEIAAQLRRPVTTGDSDREAIDAIVRLVAT